MTQVCSVFSQLLQLFSRGDFARAVKKHSAERHAKGFTCWGPFVAMLFCQVAQPANGKVLRDQIISLPGLRQDGEEPVLFRRIEYWNEDKREILVFFTNLLHLAASTIAAIYKGRWQVELFLRR